MPAYDYKCQNTTCNFEMEAIQRMSDEVLTKCPKCGCSSLIRFISVPYFMIHGGTSATLGSLADKNSKNMSQEQKEGFSTRKKKPKVIPWWEQGVDNKTKKKIEKLKTKKEISNYIEEGKLP
jgi:putative FmdB family regulatory protein